MPLYEQRPPLEVSMTKKACKGQLKSLPSPTNLPHPLKKGTPKGLVISYSLKGRVVWDAVFWFFNDSIYRYPYKALWYLIDFPHHPPPPPSICSQFSLVLLLTLLETADSPTVPPGNHVIPPPPWKKFLSDTLGNKNDSSFSISTNPKIKPETTKLP